MAFIISFRESTIYNSLFSIYRGDIWTSNFEIDTTHFYVSWIKLMTLATSYLLKLCGSKLVSYTYLFPPVLNDIFNKILKMTLYIYIYIYWGILVHVYSILPIFVSLFLNYSKFFQLNMRHQKVLGWIAKLINNAFFKFCLSLML